MTLASRVFAMIGKLPPATARGVRVERGLRARMPDGAELVADRFAPEGSGNLPIVLLRSPYGRSGFAKQLATVFAERGYQSVLQSCRGTGGSTGTFDALRDERADGLATLDWLAEQPWFGGSVVAAGPSYLGYVQWALAPGAPPFLKAIAPQVSASELRSAIYPGGTFALAGDLRFAVKMAHQGSRLGNLVERITRRDPIERAHATLPLGDADEVATGGHVSYFHDWLAHNGPGDPFWEPVDFSGRLGDVNAAVTLSIGWYDIFLPRYLADYRALRAAGKTVRLTVGPWQHTTPASGFFSGVRDALDWFDTQVRERPAAEPRPTPVRIFVPGEDAWRDLPDWPPPATSVRWHLHAGGRLDRGAPAGGGPPDTFRYDPADPTPSAGGFTLGKNAGPQDNRRLEARSDVLTYTSEPLERDLDVIGDVAAEIHFRSSRPDTDLFVRLNDVAPDGRSVNVTDMPARVIAGVHPVGSDGVTRVAMDLWPTAYRFKRGHRLRVLIASGALPRIARNLGGGESLETAVTMHVADQEVFHDPEHPSAIVLPVTAGG